MSLHFRRSVSIIPGVRLNLGLDGAGLSVGPRGLHVGVNRRGMYSSAGLPGAGLYAVHDVRTGEREHEVGGSARRCGCTMLAAMVLGPWFAKCVLMVSRFRGVSLVLDPVAQFRATDMED